MAKIISVIIFFIIYLFFGKKVAIPYGVVIFKNSILTIASLCFFDIIQAFVIVLFFETKIIKKISARVWRRFKKSNWIEKYKGWEYLGIFLMAANPFFGGGILAPTIISHLLRLKKEKYVILVILGDFIGILILIAIYKGLLLGINTIQR